VTSGFARWYLPGVFRCGALLAIVPPIAFGGSFQEWIYRALTMLVISCLVHSFSRHPWLWSVLTEDFGPEHSFGAGRCWKSYV